MKAKPGDKIRLHLVPPDPYTEEEVELDQVYLSGSMEATEDPYVFRMGDEDGTIQFTVKYLVHLVTVLPADHGTGKVNDQPGPIKAAPGDTVIVSGTPEDGYVFLSYELVSGEVQESFSLAFVMGDTDVEVRPTFRKIRTLTIVNDNPDYGECPQEGENETWEGATEYFQLIPKKGCMVNAIQVVPDTVTVATSETDYGTDCHVEIGEEDVKVFVFFKPKPGHAVNVSVTPPDSGSWAISSDPFCPDDSYPPEASVTITAMPADGYLFDYMVINGGDFNNDEVNDSSVTITMPDEEVSVEIHYKPIVYTVSVEFDPEGCGTYNYNVAPNGGADDTFLPGTETILTVDFPDDYLFDHMTVNGVTHTTPSVTLTMNEDVEVKVYANKVYTVTLLQTEGGVISADPTSGISGTEVTVTASAYDNFHLAGVDVNGTFHEAEWNQNTVTFTLTEDAVVTSSFVRVYFVSAMVDPDECGEIILSPESDDGCYPAGKEITVTVIPEDGYGFRELVIDGESYNASTKTFTMPEADVDIIAYVGELFHVSVEIEPEDGGECILSATEGFVGDKITFTPKPAEGYYYSGVGCEIVGTEIWTYTSVTIDPNDPQDIVIYVYFEEGEAPTTYPITVTVTNEGGSAFGPPYEEAGHEVYIWVSPEEGYDFVMSVNGTTLPRGQDTFEMPAEAVTVEVTFLRVYTVTVNQTEGGTIAVSPTSGLSGTEVTVTATPDANMVFAGVDVNGTFHPASGNANTVKFFLTEDVTVTPTFLVGHTLTVINDSPGEGTISVGSYGTVSRDGSFLVGEGQTVTITCTPEEGFMFSGAFDDWNSYRQTPFTITMGNTDMTVQVYFTEIPTYPVSVQVQPEASGDVRLTPLATDNSFALGTEVTVYADPADGYALQELVINDESYYSSPQTFTVTEEGGTVIAFFGRLFNVSVICNPEGGGTCSLSKSQGFDGDIISFTAHPAEGYYLSKPTVSGTAQYSDTSVTIQDDDVVIYLTFLPDEGATDETYPITVTASEHGTASGPGNAKPGDSVYIYIVPEEGYDYVMTVNGDSSASTFTMPDGPASVQVTFVPKSYSVLIDYGSASPSSGPTGTLVTAQATIPYDSGFAGVSVTDREGSVPYSSPQIVDDVVSVTFHIRASDVTVSFAFTK